MGLLDKLLRPTPFYKSYQAFKKKRAAANLAALEARLAPARVAFYKTFIAPGDTVFDVGANVGNRVEAFLQCGARVIAVEPQPACAGVLRGKFADRITIENIGLAGAPGELEMHLSSDSTVSTFSTEFIENTKDRFKFSQWTETIKVPISTMDALIEKHGMPRFCKIDVEGFEPEVLKGLHRPMPFLSLEYCVPEVSGGLRTCVEMLHALAPQGRFNYCIGERMQWALPQWLSYDDFTRHINTEAFIGTSFGDIYFKSAD